MLSALPGLVYVFDLLRSEAVFINYSFEDLLGYDAAYMRSLGATFLSVLVHPDDIESWRVNTLPRYAEAAPGAVIENEFRMRDAKGEWRWFLTRERIWRRTADNQPQQIIAIGEDITLRKASERRLDQLLRHAAEGLSLIDAQGNVLYSSPSMHRILGVDSTENPHGAFGYRFIERVYADDRMRAEQQFAALLEQPRAHVEVQVRANRADGELRWLHVSATNLLEDSDVGAIVVNFLDITEQMRSENQLRYQAKLLERVNDAVIVTDLNYVVQTWNPAAEATYGWSADEVVGRAMGEFLVTQFVDDDYTRSVRIGHTTGNWHGEVIQTRKDGSPIHVLASISLVMDAAETPVGWVAINRDISNEKAIRHTLAEERAVLAQRVEERTADLRAAYEELVKAARLKDEFLAAVSHEFRTPLQAILGFTENLAEGITGPVNERQGRYLGLIMDSGQHLLALINDILDFTKSEAGPARLELSAVPVARLCESSLGMVRSAAQHKRLHTALSLQDHDLALYADERIVKQILVNLLSNAVKFTPVGGSIGLEAYRSVDSTQVCFTVWDTGIGIDEKDRERLFQPFVQLDAGLNRQYGGTGLGLALAARLAGVHGGTIELESTVGSGSRFTLSLPLRRPADVGAEG
jgi:PAS domain S-box-containing protein